MAVLKEKQRKPGPYLYGLSGGLTIQYLSVASQSTPGSKSAPVPSPCCLASRYGMRHREKAGVKSCRQK